ncbi:hypothetical protein X801_01131 [Opisthorchis viverrini]|uniref:Peptidase A1 domain-containing protein n=1 Tax=Opisthorchis viverrini TaxID=6198 RepID=A0A1S8X8F2_OPIVI|nr:hypothetical protein X801_01131 [Opisthorchis viverrini]
MDARQICSSSLAINRDGSCHLIPHHLQFSCLPFIVQQSIQIGRGDIMEAGSIALLDTGSSKIFLPAYIFYELKRILDGRRMLSDRFLVDCSKFGRFPPIHLLIAKHRFTLHAEDYIVRVIVYFEFHCISDILIVDKASITLFSGWGS